NQASSRKIDAALGATPAALLAGSADVARDFELKAQASSEGLDWVQATPRRKDGSIQTLRIGFRNHALAAFEIIDAFGQTSRLDFKDFAANVALAADRFKFTLPKGADLIEQ
ncbi:MAG TPA: outer-membrane lipoprotein carrier protein LolA, partial [Burkholderiaceae bacterium]